MTFQIHVLNAFPTSSFVSANSFIQIYIIRTNNSGDNCIRFFNSLVKSESHDDERFLYIIFTIT